MATTAVVSTSSSMDDGTSDMGMAANTTVGAVNNESDGHPMSAYDAANALLSMGPILPANPEDTTCYWYICILNIFSLRWFVL